LPSPPWSHLPPGWPPVQRNTTRLTRCTSAGTSTSTLPASAGSVTVGGTVSSGQGYQDGSMPRSSLKPPSSAKRWMAAVDSSKK